MKFCNWRLLVLSSALALAALGSTRPRYGGTLRVQASELPAFENSPLVAETLVRIDERGDIQGVLARSWQRDAEGRRWRFYLRPRVVMHDGAPLTPQIVAAALGGKATAVGAQQVVIVADPPAPDLLERLASPKSAIVRRAADGALIGTGPFRLTRLDAAKRTASLAAFEEYWGGRPYLDTVEYSAQRGTPADALAIPVSTSRRSVPERMRLWTSPVRELIALVVPGPQAEFFSLAVDREAIANVITQKRGEVARGLLPEWLSGYASVLPAERDLARARQLAPRGQSITVQSPAGDPLLRLIAERVALNARDAGLNVTVPVQPSPGGARLVRLRLETNNAGQDLTSIARALNLPVANGLATPQVLYDAERVLLADGGIVPLVYIPDVWALDPRVRDWDPAHIANVWMEP